jgi:hypothetical protein
MLNKLFNDNFVFFLVVVVFIILVSLQLTLNKIYRVLKEIRNDLKNGR